MHSSLQPSSVTASYPVPLINQPLPSPFISWNFTGFLITVALTFLYMPSSEPFATCTQAHSRHTCVASLVSHMISTFAFAPASMKGCKLLWNGIHQTGDFKMSAHHARMSLRASPSLNSACFTRWTEMIPSRESFDARIPHWVLMKKCLPILFSGHRANQKILGR